MSKEGDDSIDMKGEAARLHHEVRYLEAMRLLREAFEVDEGEMLERLAALFGYESVDGPLAPKAEGEVEVDEQIVAWYGLESPVFAFAHPSARKGHTPAYHVPDVNPFLMDLDRLDEPTPGFVLALPLKRAEAYKKEFQLPLLRASLWKMEDALAMGVWFIRCGESEVYWVFHGISGETSGTLEKKVREHGGSISPETTRTRWSRSPSGFVGRAPKPTTRGADSKASRSVAVLRENPRQYQLSRFSFPDAHRGVRRPQRQGLVIRPAHPRMPDAP